jgi:hypothetical protein
VNDTALVPAPRVAPLSFRVGVITHVIEPVEYGFITIRFEAGRPTLVERHEQIRLTGGGTRPQLDK